MLYINLVLSLRCFPVTKPVCDFEIIWSKFILVYLLSCLKLIFISQTTEKSASNSLIGLYPCCLLAGRQLCIDTEIVTYSDIMPFSKQKLKAFRIHTVFQASPEYFQNFNSYAVYSWCFIVFHLFFEN